MLVVLLFSLSFSRTSLYLLITLRFRKTGIAYLELMVVLLLSSVATFGSLKGTVLIYSCYHGRFSIFVFFNALPRGGISLSISALLLTNTVLKILASCRVHQDICDILHY